MNKLLWIASAAALAGALSATACSSSDSSSDASSSTGPASCAEDPFSCPAGQTCWPDGTTAPTSITCLNSGQGKLGDACESILGQPSCGDALACIAPAGDPTKGTCTPFCDNMNPAHACPANYQCAEIIYTDSLHDFACVPLATPTGAGGGGGGGGAGGGAGGSGGAGGK